MNPTGVIIKLYVLALLAISVFCARDVAAEVAGWIQPARALREKLQKDPHRPGYHIVAPEGLCGPFDPNGALFWKGRYHLMYIIQTQKGHCWAHISSRDLVHWRHHPLCLEPGEGDRGIFSGGAFLDRNGTATITYWGLGDDRGICIATSTDDGLDRWTKSPHNPVIRQTGFGYAARGGQVYGVADPSAIWIHQALRGEQRVVRPRHPPVRLGQEAVVLVPPDVVLAAGRPGPLEVSASVLQVRPQVDPGR